MKKLILAIRIVVFLIGVMFIAFGVSFSTKAMLGTSPISAIPYSLSLYFDNFSFGSWVIAFNMSLVFLEIILLKFNIKFYNIIIQLLLAICFGCFIDLSMFILSSFNPVSYFYQILSVVIGCFLLAFGVCLDILTDISVLPGDGFVLAVSKKINFDYGRVRLISDLIMSAIAFVMCILLVGTTQGVREGTIISAIITGLFVMLIMKIISCLKTNIYLFK